MNLVQRQIFGNKSAVTYNTYIGGVSATISTASALATKLGISVGAISNFTVAGSDIRCKITGSYEMPSLCWNGNTAISYYFDTDNLVSKLKLGAFKATTNIKNIEFIGVTVTENDVFRDSTIQLISLPYATTVGDFYCDVPQSGRVYNLPRATTIGVFTNASIDCTLYINPSLSANSNVTYVSSNGGSVVSVSNFTLPSSIVDLAVGTIYNTAAKVTFSNATSSNGIAFYEVYRDGIFCNRVMSGGTAYHLLKNTSHNLTVIARDIYYNGTISNITNVATLNIAISTYSTDADATTYLTNAGISSTDAVNSSNYIFYQLKVNALYDKIQNMYLYKGTTAAMQKYNVKNPLDTNAAFRQTFTGAATFSDLGYQLNGSSYANSYFKPSANQNVNSNGLTIVVGTNNSAYSSDVVEIGSYNSSSQSSLMVVKNNNTNYQRATRMNGNPVFQNGVNEARGIFTGTKQRATVTNLFITGVKISSGNSGGALSTYDGYVGCLNVSGSPYGHSNQRIQVAIWHEGFTDAETILLHSILDYGENLAGRKTW